MPISFGSRPKDDDVLGLIAAKSYGRAIELLKARLRAGASNPTLRMQLADVLILADKKAEGVALLLRLADEYASEGFAAKAVSVLKKAQRVDPGRRDVDSRLAQLIETKQREAAADRLPEPDRTLEIGLDLGAISVPVSSPARPALLDLDPDATLPYETADRPSAAAAAATAVLATPVTASDASVPVLEAEPLPALAEEPSPGLVGAEAVPLLEPEVAVGEPAEAVPVLEAELAPVGGGEPDVEDYDLLYIGGEAEPEAPSPAAPAGAAVDAMSAGEFAGELMSLVDTVLQESSAAEPAGGPRPGSRIVVSPLFRDFAVDEMVAVIQGLRLLTVERGDVVLREGQPGGSLYMITSGRVRAFRKDGAGRQLPLGDLQEGAFFGEMSVLTGRPRMASVVALTRSELLELDRPTLDAITRTHPRVWDVLREFAGSRAAANSTGAATSRR